MKNIISLLAIVFAFTVNAQTITFNPKTGDIEMDNILKDINTKAKENIEIFKNDVSTKFNVAKNKIDEMLKVLAPGDIYMVAQTSQIVSKPIDEVSKTYQANKDKGWGQVAKDLGIKPGSKEFHAMKDKMKTHGNKGGKDKKDKESKEKGSKEDEGKNKPGTEKDEKAGGKGKGKK